MKARSAIFTAVQKPFAMFGLPPKLTLVVLIPAVLLFQILLTAGLMAAGFFALVLTCAGGGLFLWRMNKRDWHMEQMLLIGLPWFKGKTTRHLISGPPVRRAKGKERPF